MSRFDSINIRYYMTEGGKCDCGEVIDWGEYELNPEQAAAWKRAVMTGETLEDVEEIQPILKAQEDDILEQERQCFEELGYGEDTGETLDEIMDNYSLVIFPEEPDPPEDDEVIDYLKELFAAGDAGTAGAVVDANEDSFDGCLWEEAFKLALNAGCDEYVSDHVDDIDLNPEGGETSPYIYETDDETCREILIDAGAFVSWDEYMDCRLAIETVNYSVIAFDPDFQQELFEHLLQELGITEEDFAEMLVDDEKAEAFKKQIPQKFFPYSIEEMAEAFQAEPDGDCVSLKEFRFLDNPHGAALGKIVKELGEDICYEGYSWKLDSSGVEFIE